MKRFQIIALSLCLLILVGCEASRLASLSRDQYDSGDYFNAAMNAASALMIKAKHEKAILAFKNAFPKAITQRQATIEEQIKILLTAKNEETLSPNEKIDLLFRSD